MKYTKHLLIYFSFLSAKGLPRHSIKDIEFQCLDGIEINQSPIYFEQIEDSVFKNIENRWKIRDGAAVFDIGDQITSLLVKNPKEVFLWFSKNEEILRDYVENFEPYVMTDYSGNQKESILKTKANLLASITNFKILENGTNIKGKVDSVLTKICEAKYRKID